MTSSIVSKATGKILVPFTREIDALWPNVPVLEHRGVNYAILSHDPRTQIKLRAAGLEVPAPILTHYNWARGTPFQIQKHTAALSTSYSRSYILNDMGTGKTKSALWSWHYLHKAGCAGKLLVVAPLSTLKFVWLREVHMTLPGVKAVVLHGTRERRRNLLDGDADVFIINHDGLRTIVAELNERLDIDTLVIDELAVYRNNSLRSKLMREFARRFVWCWGMTGRPMPNSPTDVWSQCKILTPGNVPKYFRHARTQLMTQIDQFKWVPKPNATELALSWMRPSVRYSLDDVVELPEAVSRTIQVEFTEQQAKVYRKLSNEMAVMIENRIITAANAGVALQKLLQIGGGYVYTNNPEYVTLDSDPRKAMLLEILEEAEHKVLVFAPWRHLLAGLSKFLEEHEIDHAVIHGSVSPKERDQIFSDFQHRVGYKTLLAHPMCLAHGLTLTAANVVVWYSPVTSLDIYEQANARIRRVGQTKKQQFLHLQGSPVERKVYAMLARKQRTQDEFLQMIKSANNGAYDVEIG